jgi:hypothetical protein
MTYPISLLPHVIGAVHVDSALPILGLQVVLLGLSQLALSLQLLSQVKVSVLANNIIKVK